jgi:hypothetical protein
MFPRSPSTVIFVPTDALLQYLKPLMRPVDKENKRERFDPFFTFTRGMEHWRQPAGQPLKIQWPRKFHPTENLPMQERQSRPCLRPESPAQLRQTTP